MDKYFLRKRENEFWLESRSENHCTVIAEVEPKDPLFDSKLSHKNCQAIELGYDLDELADKYEDVNYKGKSRSYNIGFKHGFQKALELMGDKKFSEEDVKKAIFQSHGVKANVEQIIQSLQQTEWEVAITMKNSRTGKILNSESDLSWNEDGLCDEAVPLLDENGCLILKKK